jgi:CBS domain-containing protein
VVLRRELTNAVIFGMGAIGYRWGKVVGSTNDLLVTEFSLLHCRLSLQKIPFPQASIGSKFHGQVIREILVINDSKLMGILTQGDCDIKVMLPVLDAKQVQVKEVMTIEPVMVKLEDPIEACIGLMASRNFRHLPIIEAGLVVGVISIGNVVKDSFAKWVSKLDF